MNERIHIATASALRAEAAPMPAVAPVLCGMAVADAMELLPRLFNLCRVAQSIALRLALGLFVRSEDRILLMQEILREHRALLAVKLPVSLGLDPIIPANGDAHALAGALFGDQGFPGDVAGFDAFMASNTGMAPVLRAIAGRFAPGEASSGILPAFTHGRALEKSGVENSVALRHPNHRVLEHIAQHWGRGPLWRVVARAIEVQACCDGWMPEAFQIGPGMAQVPAARGSYVLFAQEKDGYLSAFDRVTPSDHMLAHDGMVARALASLPPEKHRHAQLVMHIFDPCVPVSLKGGAQDA